MNSDTPRLISRLPTSGTTIFATMSALAQQHGAVNLGQGFPDFEADAKLIDLVSAAMRAGHNQYPPMPGLPALREAVAAKIERLYGHRYDPGSEITITAGATQAILSTILALVHPGDEVIVLEPCYDSYGPAIVLAGGRVVPVPLTPGSFDPDFSAIAAALTPRTRAIVINTPHNPSGSTWNAAQMRALDALLAPTNVVLISDEVYEHMVFDGAVHKSASRLASLAARSVVISSFGKSFHVTGWKIGTVAAPAALSAEFRKVHQFNVFSVNTPMQHALAAYLENPAPYTTLPDFYAAKRDHFRAGLAANTSFELLPASGTYFQCVRYDTLPEPLGSMPEQDFCRWLTVDLGVAAIPLSAFYADGFEQKVVRFCFAKRETTLDLALARLARLG
ncbi:MAG: hypothetical protein RLZZ598_1462 [Pseudomonadota bacterium]